MEIFSEQKDGTMILSIEGDIFSEDANVLRDCLMESMEKGTRHFSLDLGKVSFIDSTGIGVLISVQKKLLQNNGEMTIVNVQGKIKELFEWTRMDKLFTIS